MEIKKYDGLVFGASAGLLASTPKFSAWVADKLAGAIPASWQFFGSWSIPFYGVLAGAILGLIVDKS